MLCARAPWSTIVNRRSSNCIIDFLEVQGCDEGEKVKHTQVRGEIILVSFYETWGIITREKAVQLNTEICKLVWGIQKKIYICLWTKSLLFFSNPCIVKLFRAPCENTNRPTKSFEYSQYQTKSGDAWWVCYVTAAILFLVKYSLLVLVKKEKYCLWEIYC